MTRQNGQIREKKLGKKTNGKIIRKKCKKDLLFEKSCAKMYKCQADV